MRQNKIYLKMYLFAMLLASTNCSSVNIPSQACLKCNLTIVIAVNQNLNRISYEKVDTFLCTLHESCKSNIEFSEVSNETLFKVLFEKPEFVLKSLSNNTDLAVDFILLRLTDPINDQIDLHKLHAKVAEVKGYGDLKEKVLKSLNEAKDKI